MRKLFREEKKIEKRKRAADDALKGKFALPEGLKLLEEDEKEKSDAREVFQHARAEREDEAKRLRMSGVRVPTAGASSSTLGRSTSSSKQSSNASALLRRQLFSSGMSSSVRARTKPPQARSLGLVVRK